MDNKKTILILPSYGLNDPPTINTINSCIKEGYSVVVFQFAEKYEAKNFKLVQIPNYTSVSFLNHFKFY